MIGLLECPVCALVADSPRACPDCNACLRRASDQGARCACWTGDLPTQLALFCSRCGEPTTSTAGVCPLCEWRRDDEQAFAQMRREVAEDRAAEAARERLWWEDDAGWA